MLAAETLLLPNRLALIRVPSTRSAHLAASQLVFELAARLSMAGPLRVFDGGNLFNVYPLARALRQLTPDSAILPAVLKRIRVSRAFTCYQVASLLESSSPEPVPTLVLDLLSTFYDENVSLVESRRLLVGCLSHLQRLSQVAPVVVTGREPGPSSESRRPLLGLLQSAATHIWEMGEKHSV